MIIQWTRCGNALAGIQIGFFNLINQMTNISKNQNYSENIMSDPHLLTLVYFEKHMKGNTFWEWPYVLSFLKM